ncbi:hypothetical protein FRC01_006782, partial [Tulasnella sp. 417]
VPGATPQNVGNSYSSATGTSRTSESEVWTFNRDTNAITVQWVNTDGSKPETHLFTQSTALYAGGDPAAFLSRYPSPVVRVSYWPQWVGIAFKNLRIVTALAPLLLAY